MENTSRTYKEDALGWSQEDQVCNEGGVPIPFTEGPRILALKLLPASHLSELKILPKYEPKYGRKLF